MNRFYITMFVSTEQERYHVLLDDFVHEFQGSFLDMIQVVKKIDPMLPEDQFGAKARALLWSNYPTRVETSYPKKKNEVRNGFKNLYMLSDEHTFFRIQEDSDTVLHLTIRPIKLYEMITIPIESKLISMSPEERKRALLRGHPTLPSIEQGRLIAGKLGLFAINPDKSIIDVFDRNLMDIYNPTDLSENESEVIRLSDFLQDKVDPGA